MPRYVDICEFNDSTGMFFRVRRADIRTEFIQNTEEFKAAVSCVKTIDTAPKDGSIVLGYDPSWYHMWTPIHYVNGHWEFFHVSDLCYPTHWMAMPKLPTLGIIET